MSEAKYIDLKKLLYCKCCNYIKLKEIVKTHLDIKLSDCKYNETLHKKDGSIITLEELDEMIKQATVIQSMPNL